MSVEIVSDGDIWYDTLCRNVKNDAIVLVFVSLKTGKKCRDVKTSIRELYLKKIETNLPGSCIDLIINNPNYIDDIHRCCDINILWLAGNESIAYTVAWTLLGLARNPSIQSDLHFALKKESERAGTQGN